jgi:amino acid transporter
MLPGGAATARALSANSERFGTPVLAIALQTLAATALCGLNFNTLVVAEILFACIALVLQFGAFIRLKATAPDAPRS